MLKKYPQAYPHSSLRLAILGPAKKGSLKKQASLSVKDDFAEQAIFKFLPDASLMHQLVIKSAIT